MTDDDSPPAAPATSGTSGTNGTKDTAVWMRRRPGMKRTATGTGLTNPPWHRIVSAPSAATPLTACGKRLRGANERTRAAVPPSDGPACPACTTVPTGDLSVGE